MSASASARRGRRAAVVAGVLALVLGLAAIAVLILDRPKEIPWAVAGTADGGRTLVVAFPEVQLQCTTRPELEVSERTNDRLTIRARIDTSGDCSSDAGVLYPPQRLRLATPLRGEQVSGPLRTKRTVGDGWRGWWPETPELPTVVGLSVEQAMAVLRDNRLKGSIVEGSRSGWIVKQSPDGGEGYELRSPPKVRLSASS